MFSDYISDTPFTSEGGFELFNRVGATGTTSDAVLVSVMRALLTNRLQPDQKSRARFVARSSWNYNPADLGAVFLDGGYELVVLSVNHLEDKAIEETINVTKSLGMSEKKDLALFVLKNKMTARFYINEEKRQTVVLGENIGIRESHILGAMLPRLLPWHFKDKPLDDTEFALLRSLTNRYPMEFMDQIYKIAERFDIERAKIIRMLGDFEQKATERQMEEVRNALHNADARIRENLDRYTRLITERSDLNLKLLGLESMAANAKDSTELVDYIVNNKSISIKSVTDTTIEFYVKCYLDLFDPEVYSSVRRNDGSYLYHRSSLSTEDTQLLFDHVLSDTADCRVKFLSYYRIDILGDVASSSHFSIPSDCRDRIVNPHIYYYECLGDHRRYINELLMNHDIIGAIEQCVASAKSLNLAEPATAGAFVQDLSFAEAPVIELPDGSCVNTQMALQWAKEQNGGEQ